MVTSIRGIRLGGIGRFSRKILRGGFAASQDDIPMRKLPVMHSPGSRRRGLHVDQSRCRLAQYVENALDFSPKVLRSTT
jgi:hypothetical protein